MLVIAAVAGWLGFQLFLHDNPISDENVAHIGLLVNLEMLGLAGTNVTDDGLTHLANLKNLRYLGFTRQMSLRLASKNCRPGCQTAKSNIDAVTHPRATEHPGPGFAHPKRPVISAPPRCP